MSAYAIISEIANFTKPSKDAVVIKPQGKYIGTELNDDRLNKLYGAYCGLLMEQYAEDCEQSTT